MTDTLFQPNKELVLTSPAFTHGAAIPVRYTCRGEDINPPLQIHNAAPETKSFTLIMHDPDAPRGDWVHWVVWNITPQTLEIAENSVPSGAAEGMTSFGRPGYGGPCPPKGTGTHHYIFELCALDNLLDLGKTAGREDIEQAMQSHLTARCALTGLFSAEQ